MTVCVSDVPSVISTMEEVSGVAAPRAPARPKTVIISYHHHHRQHCGLFVTCVFMRGRSCVLRRLEKIVKDIARQSCGMVPRWRLFGDFLRAVFSANRAQHVSDLHCKFTLRPHHVVDIQSPTAEIRRGKNIWPALLHRAAINQEINDSYSEVTFMSELYGTVRRNKKCLTGAEKLAITGLIMEL